MWNATPGGSTGVAQQKVERRLAAILAADVVGYSRLTGADEERTLTRLKTLRPGIFAMASGNGNQKPMSKEVA
jgi:class 3 adenylate cyclase